MPQKGLKREKRGMGRKEKKFPQNFFFCLPDHELTMIGNIFYNRLLSFYYFFR